MFLVTTEWRAKHWPGCPEQIQEAGLVFFQRSPTEIEVHKDVLFGNEGKVMDKVDGHLLAHRYCDDPRVVAARKAGRPVLA